MDRPSLTWVSRPANRKTGSIPTAYAGGNTEEIRKTCNGCALLGNGCYAWASVSRGLPALFESKERNPERYKMRRAVDHRRRDAKMARIGAIGDPARVNRRELRAAIAYIRKQELSVVGYTHFWRNEPRNGVLKHSLMASCNNVEETTEAFELGWRPAVVLPWDHEGKFFEMPGHRRGLVCPAQTKGVTCNDCRLCDPSHKVWEAGKVEAIGFIDHGPKARRKIKKKGKALPLAG